MTEHQTEHTLSKSTVRKLNYLLYLPENYADPSDAKFPLLLFLHGIGEGGDDLQKVKTHGPPKRIEEGKAFSFIVLSPQNPEQKPWDDSTVIELLNEIIETYRVDTQRIYLTGMSCGGYGAWRLAIQHPNRFAALIPICGGGVPFFAPRIKHLPIWVFHGAKDPVIPISESQRLVNALEDCGANVQFTIYPDTEHDSWTETYENPAVYDWMLAQVNTN